MHATEKNYSQALQYVRGYRSNVWPNEGFQKQLILWHEMGCTLYDGGDKRRHSSATHLGLLIDTYFDTPTRRGGAQDMNMYNIGQQPTFGGQMFPPILAKLWNAACTPSFQGRQFAATGTPRTASTAAAYLDMPMLNQTNTTCVAQADRDSSSQFQGLTAPEMKNDHDAAADPFTSGHDDNTAVVAIQTSAEDTTPEESVSDIAMTMPLPASPSVEGIWGVREIALMVSDGVRISRVGDNEDNGTGTQARVRGHVALQI
ncbi:hypothetical protein H2200_010752 [Cladophialophora chaetospira]|uniref:Uncharacterized protein n=1 Tax=Cladophialophora chaetospira TaxID=386627 RepID=A0AA38X0P1_9EURO|nr:hypothetical protein H2200_010752 [Cladophialophora chaetospira]